MTALVKSSSVPVSKDANVHKCLEDAIADFRTVLSDDQRKQMSAMGGHDNVPDADAVMVFTAELDLQNRQRRGKSFASRLYPLLSSVESFCTVMSGAKVSNVGDVYVSSHPEIAALIWGSMKLTMTVSGRLEQATTQ
jgi:hypothetical protein